MLIMACLFIVRFGLFVVGENLFELRFQFVNAVRHGNDGAVAVDEEQGTILSAMLTEYIKLVIEVNETGRDGCEALC